MRELREANKKTEEELAEVNITSFLRSNDDVDNIAVRNAALDVILESWEGLLDENGEVLSYSNENALMLADNGYPLLAGAWVEIARWLMAKHEQHEETAKQESVGNSETSQTGAEGDSEI